MIATKMESKIVFDGKNGTYREVFYSRSGRQVAVVDGFCPYGPREGRYERSSDDFYLWAMENQGEWPFHLSDWSVSIPVSGMGGWGIKCNSKAKAQKIANNEKSKVGKAYNRFVRLPVAFLSGTLL